ncbi:MAG TPA: DUF2254 domain-containing protein, partial [Planctomycetota bacterium]|nr:DUF2254 domain-containing protein [Planctomycetota bacterium]
MRARLLHFGYILISSYWFVPTLMALLAFCLALGCLHLDAQWRDEEVLESGWTWSGGATSAQQLLGTIAGSMITVAGVVFSVTIVALTLASSQFGPRLLTTFMRDLGNQIVLGTFIATFLYCLMVLRSIRVDPPYVAHISVTVALVLAVLSIAVLIYFIHHVPTSIQAERIIASVGRDLDETIEQLYPGGAGA